MNQANLFELESKDGGKLAALQVVYAASGIDGRPSLQLSMGQQQRSFRGAELSQASTALGNEITVTLEVVPDGWVKTFTLVLPTVNCREGDVQIDAFASLTTERSSIGGPALVNGAIQLYELHALSGTARAVVF